MFKKDDEVVTKEQMASILEQEGHNYRDTKEMIKEGKPISTSNGIYEPLSRIDE
jgi:hypothetical protein